MQARFHRYSWGNVALILAQRPDATRVAGYQTWRGLGRQVRRGERGITIIVPMRRKRRDDEDIEAQELERVFFGTGTVFDISQTDGPDLPHVDVPVLEGDAGQELAANLEALARRQGLALLYATGELPGSAMGAYDFQDKRILLREAAPAQMAKTLAHELAHHVAGHTHSTPETESVAEACAYVVCGHFGLDTGSRSFPYVALWSRQPDVLKGVLSTVQRVSAGMIAGMEGPSAPSDEQVPTA